MFFNLITTIHIHSCVMLVLLYVLSLIWPFMVLFSCSSETFLNNFLNVNNGIIFLLLLVSILYGITMELPHDCSSSSAINNDQFLFKCTELIPTVSFSPSLHSCDSLISSSFTTPSLLLQHTFLKCLVLPQPMHILPYARHCLCMCPAIISAWAPLCSQI